MTDFRSGFKEQYMTTISKENWEEIQHGFNKCRTPGLFQLSRNRCERTCYLDFFVNEQESIFVIDYAEQGHKRERFVYEIEKVRE